jgi:iron complex outermembrane receptor protein
VIRRTWLDASPRQQTSEMLTLAPGFFVDHEDGEGFGNDVYLRGFDLDHGSGIEMRLGAIPLNVPTHIHGQGYADVNFIIPEAVRSLRVQQGPYDPRQGDAAIVGSAAFDLGVPDRGYMLKTSYGSFAQKRVVGIAAPEGADPDTFVAASFRDTDGFGTSRSGRSGSVNAQYGLDLSPTDRLKFVATGYGAMSNLAGIVREDDVDAGRIGFYDRYPHYAAGQSVQTSRIILGSEFVHDAGRGSRFSLAPFFMWTDFRARENYTGSLQSSQVKPSLSGLGDLFETTNREDATGLTASYRTRVARLAPNVELVGEPGVYTRYGQSKQTKSLLVPDTLKAWDRRLDQDVSTLDVGAFVDLDFRFWKKLRLSGGVRVDFLSVQVLDRLANFVPEGFPPGAALPEERRSASGVSVGPRATAEYAVTELLSVVGSYGEGYRSLNVNRLAEGARPYSKVRSVEGGMKAHDARRRYSTTLSIFQTWVGNELVFVAEEGGLETQNASTRRGVVGSFMASPNTWLLASTALSVTTAEYLTRVPGISHRVPNVPPILLHAELSARGKVAEAFGRSVVGRIGAGYTFMSGKPLADDSTGPVTHALNAGGQLRCGAVEIGVDVYNALGFEYADSAERYISNWSMAPGQQPASRGTHLTAAPPRTVVGSLSLYF